MVKQYAHCIQDRLASYNITDIELNFDVWMSLNNRFQQRSGFLNFYAVFVIKPVEGSLWVDLKEIEIKI